MRFSNVYMISAILMAYLACQEAYATSWDWSRGDGSVVITYDKFDIDSNKPDYSDMTPQNTASNILYWNGSGFSNKDGAILARKNARSVSPIREEVTRVIGVESESKALDPVLLHAIITAESSGDEQAISHAGAKGLMQLMPATAERFGVLDTFDPAQNIRGGATYLRFLLDRYDGDVWRAVAAYNAGEARIDRGTIPAESRAIACPRASRRLDPGADRVMALWINQRTGQTQ